MTDGELISTIEKYVRNENFFTTEVKTILVAYKNAGGPKENAQKLLGQLAKDFSENELYKTEYMTYSTLLQVGVILK